MGGRNSFLRAVIAIGATFLLTFGAGIFYQFVIYENFAPNNRYKHKLYQSADTAEDSYAKTYPFAPGANETVAYYDRQLREYMGDFIEAKERYALFKARVQYGLALGCIDKQLKQTRTAWWVEGENYRRNARNAYTTTPQMIRQSKENERLLFENEKIFDFDLIEDVETTLLYPVGPQEKDLCSRQTPIEDVFPDFMALYLERYDTVNNSAEWYNALKKYFPVHFARKTQEKNEAYKRREAFQQVQRKRKNEIDRKNEMERVSLKHEKQLTELKESIAAGHDIEARDKRGYTRLQIAILEKNGKAVALLLDQGADMYARDASGYHSAFSLAAEDIEMFKLFMQHGANVNYQYNKSETALTLAAKGCKNFELVKLLLLNGADPDLIDEYGFTTRNGLFRYCKKDKNYEMMMALLNTPL